jgi:hypothetical protein
MVRILHFCFQFIFTFKRNILFSVCIWYHGRYTRITVTHRDFAEAFEKLQ